MHVDVHFCCDAVPNVLLGTETLCMASPKRSAFDFPSSAASHSALTSRQVVSHLMLVDPDGVVSRVRVDTATGNEFAVSSAHAQFRLWRECVPSLLHLSSPAFHIDLSCAPMALCQLIMRHMYRSDSLPTMEDSPLVVDIGAMNGVSGSNAYNFLELGWSGVLYEVRIAVFVFSTRLADSQRVLLATRVW